jgi:V/A-type H+/Na+-transporting ATPase subunit E
MSIEIFIQEIENRKKKDISIIEKQLNEKKLEIENQKTSKIQELKQSFEKDANSRSEREAARILEGGKLDAKKILFDAINKNLDSTFDIIKKDLGEYTQNPEYKNILKKMIKTSKNALGENITIHLKEEDKSFFNDSDVTLGSTIQTLGGIIAENSDGTKELDLTFEELLRNNEDEIKTSILEEIL